MDSIYVLYQYNILHIHHSNKFVYTIIQLQILTERFAGALRKGRHEEAVLLYDTGNVNLHTPLSIYVNCEYPIHCAIEGKLSGGRESDLTSL